MDDLEHDEANEEMMKSMGFAAFGSTDNRPKQQAPGQQNQKQKLPPRPPATGANAQIQGQPGPGGRMETFVRDRGFGGGQRGGRGRGEDGPSKRQKFDNDDEGGFSGSRGRGKNKWEGFEQGGQGDEEWFYSPSFGGLYPIPSYGTSINVFYSRRPLGQPHGP